MADLAEQDLDAPAWRVWAKRTGIALSLGAAMWGAVRLVDDLLKAPSAPQRQTARIAIVPNTPPPPPPPPKEEKKPEPKEAPKQATVEQPKPVPQQPTEQVKMEGPGSDTGLAGIAAGKVTNEYAGQTPGSKIGGDGGAASRFAWYKLVVQQLVQSELQKNDKLRSTTYRVVVKIWLKNDGSVSRALLSNSTGDKDMDEKLRAALLELPPFPERPPEGLPQPITMRLTTHS